MPNSPDPKPNPIRATRERLGESVEAFSVRLTHVCGEHISAARVRSWEHGETLPIIKKPGGYDALAHLCYPRYTYADKAAERLRLALSEGRPPDRRGKRGLDRFERTPAPLPPTEAQTYLEHQSVGPITTNVTARRTRVATVLRLRGKVIPLAAQATSESDGRLILAAKIKARLNAVE